MRPPPAGRPSPRARGRSRTGHRRRPRPRRPGRASGSGRLSCRGTGPSSSTVWSSTGCPARRPCSGRGRRPRRPPGRARRGGHRGRPRRGGGGRHAGGRARRSARGPGRRSGGRPRGGLRRSALSGRLSTGPFSYTVAHRPYTSCATLTTSSGMARAAIPRLPARWTHRSAERAVPATGGTGRDRDEAGRLPWWSAARLRAHWDRRRGTGGALPRVRFAAANCCRSAS